MSSLVELSNRLKEHSKILKDESQVTSGIRDILDKMLAGDEEERKNQLKENNRKRKQDEENRREGKNATFSSAFMASSGLKPVADMTESILSKLFGGFTFAKGALLAGAGALLGAGFRKFPMIALALAYQDEIISTLKSAFGIEGDTINLPFDMGEIDLEDPFVSGGLAIAVTMIAGALIKKVGSYVALSLLGLSAIGLSKLLRKAGINGLADVLERSGNRIRSPRGSDLAATAAQRAARESAELATRESAELAAREAARRAAASAAFNEAADRRQQALNAIRRADMTSPAVSPKPIAALIDPPELKSPSIEFDTRTQRWHNVETRAMVGNARAIEINRRASQALNAISPDDALPPPSLAAGSGGGRRLGRRGTRFITPADIAKMISDLQRANADKVRKLSVRYAGRIIWKTIPILGLAAGVAFLTYSLVKGDWTTAVLEGTSLLLVGPGGIPIDMTAAVTAIFHGAYDEPFNPANPVHYGLMQDLVIVLKDEIEKALKVAEQEKRINRLADMIGTNGFNYTGSGSFEFGGETNAIVSNTIADYFQGDSGRGSWMTKGDAARKLRTSFISNLMSNVSSTGPLTGTVQDFSNMFNTDANGNIVPKANITDLSPVITSGGGNVVINNNNNSSNSSGVTVQTSPILDPRYRNIPVEPY